MRPNSLVHLMAWCVVATTVAACSSTEAAPSSARSAASSEGVREAETNVQALMQPPPPLDIPALRTKAPTGKVIYGVTCKLPECTAGEAAFNEATASLGWKYVSLKTDLGPEAYSASWTRAVAAKPDGGIYSSPLAPESVIASQLAQAEADGTAVSLGSTPLSAGEQGVDGSIAGKPWWVASATALADWTIADSEGTGKYLFVYDPSYPLQVDANDAFVKQVQRLAPDAKVDSLKVDLSEAGNALPGQVISYLQKNPDTGYAMTAFSTTFLGVGQAVKAAGLKTRIGTAYSQPANLAAVKSGTEAVAIPNETGSTAYRITDILVRHAAGEAIPPHLSDPAGARQIIDATNVDQIDVNAVWEPPNYKETFEAAWGLN